MVYPRKYIAYITILTGLLLAVLIGAGSPVPAADGRSEAQVAMAHPALDRQEWQEWMVASSANATVLEQALLVLDRLQRGEAAFPAAWIGGANDQDQIEVVVIWDEERVMHDFVLPGAPDSDAIMDELRAWLVDEPAGDVPAHYFVDDFHTGTYANVVLSLSQGIFWLQFDGDGRPTKLWLEPHDVSQPLPVPGETAPSFADLEAPGVSSTSQTPASGPSP